ncbi:tastin [Mixophyes fleayi]|uniref:tastin n=1 Tax=Mixophyes fleayi TaxID=3061075 RepID=UPI003F4DF137
MEFARGANLLIMQPVNQAPTGMSNKPSDLKSNSWVKGKENCLSPPTSLQDKQKPTMQKIVLKDPQKSKLPVPSKSRAPPDFQKMHQAWQNHFHKGKAVNKKPCTRPQPFNFSQKGDRFSVRTPTDVGPPVNPPASHRVREPLAEVVHGVKNLKCKDVHVKDGSEVEFKADPVALFSILSNVGVPTAATGKLSLAQRVPMRVSSASQPFSNCRNMMFRSSMYTMQSSQTVPSNLDRMSYFSKMHTKANDQKPQCRQNDFSKSHIPDTSSKEPAASKKDGQLQENPVLQQMNLPPYMQTSGTTTPALATQKVNAVKSAPLPLNTENVTSAVFPAVKCQKSPLEVNASAENSDPLRNTGDKQNSDAGSGGFVADSQALASILSNIGVTIGNCGKLSLAQRVPVQGTNGILKVGMATTPKPSYGHVSKNIVFSPRRVPNTGVTSNQSSAGSARRVHKQQCSIMTFSQPRSVTSKQPIVPKTPRALALENANKRLEAENSDTRTSVRATIRWMDESPSSISEVVCENEPDLEQVAMRLSLDGECPGERDKQTDLNEASDPVKVFNNATVNVQQQMQVVLSENSVTNTEESTAGDIWDASMRMNLHPAPLSQPSTSDPCQPSSSCVSCVKTFLPLSFLSHPAVKALQSHYLGPLSLPKIARLRLEATMSSKQRFWDAYLDEECAFYTSRGAASSRRSCKDPVSSFLERQEDMHFIPIFPGDS